MIVFEYQYDTNYPKITIEMHKDADLLELCEQFESFLRTAGYVFDGHVVIRNEE